VLIKIVTEEWAVPTPGSQVLARRTFAVYLDGQFIWRHISANLATAHASNLMQALPFSSLDPGECGLTKVASSAER
jgi:hypothetical protein